MKKHFIALLALISVSLFSACSTSNLAADTSATTTSIKATTTVAEPTLDEYKLLVSDYEQCIMADAILLANIGKYEANFIKASENIDSSITQDNLNTAIDKAFEWLVDYSDKTRNDFETSYETIKEKYRKLVQTEISGNEATKISECVDDMYNGYCELYNATLISLGGTSSIISEDVSNASKTITSADDKLAVFVDLSESTK